MLFHKLKDRDIQQILYSIPKKKNLKLANKNFKLAKVDFDSARSDFKRKEYNISIYHLQQAVEKTAKSFGFHYGIIDLRDSKQIGHKGHVVFLILLQINEYLIRNTDGLTNSPIYAFTTKNLETLEEFRKKSTNPEFTYELIEKIIKIIYNIERESKLFVENTLHNDDIEEIGIVINETDEEFHFILEMLYLAFVTEIHESYSRYIAEKDEQSPLDVYKKGNPLIDNLPILFKITKKCFNRYQKFLNNPSQLSSKINNPPKIIHELKKTFDTEINKK